MAMFSLCFNCNIALRANRPSLEILNMDPDIVSIFEEWNNQEVYNTERVCTECFNLALVSVNQNEPRPERRVGHHNLCVSCGLSIAPRSGRQSRPIPEGQSERAYIASIFPREISAGDRVCNRCWQQARYRAQHELLHSSSGPSEVEESHNQGPALHQDPDDIPSPEPEAVSGPEPEPIPGPEPEPRPGPVPAAEPSSIILANYSRTPDTSNHCFVPDCANSERLRVPKYLRKHILKSYKLFITKNCRVCQEHAVLYNWDIVNDYEFMSEFKSNQIEEMLDLLGYSSTEQLNFEDVENMNENILHYWTGLNLINFLSIFNVIANALTNCKRKKMALGLYLVKLRTGESFDRMGSIFKITASVVRGYVQKVRACLENHYTPLHLGVGHVTREGMSMRNLIIPQGLFGTEERNIIVICDGTYIYVEKSSNYLFQKKTYSLHKFRNLVKPFLIVAPDGHILDVFGPFASTLSDADIMKLLFQNSNSELRGFFRENDVFILDRGFRDSIPLLTSLGYRVHKPESRSVNEGPQLSTIKANKSRLVTMCRWVVEVINGRFKRDFKIFRQNYFNKMAKHLIVDMRNAAAILNNFSVHITDHPNAEALLERAQQRLYLPNYLADYVEQNNLNRRRAQFISIDAQIPELNVFPVMQMSDLVLFALGTYQIKQARSYYGEHIRANGTFIVEVQDNLVNANVPGAPWSAHETVLIRGRIKSRHTSSTVYYTYIILKIAIGDWQERICGYYCSCIIGKRTVGSCAHVMTMVWYLGWARHQGILNIAPATHLDSVLVTESF